MSLAGALRNLARAFRFRGTLPAIAVFTLTIGIGVNTAIFTVASAVFLKPLPYAEPDQLVMIWRVPEGRGSVLTGFFDAETLQRQIATPALLLGWKEQQQSLAALAAIEFQNGPLSQTDVHLPDGRIERVGGALVTPEFFETLGVSASAGRTFVRSDHADVAVVSRSLWEHLFGLEPFRDGMAITVDAERNRARKILSIVGVLPDRFQFTYPAPIDLWLLAPWHAVETANPDELKYAVVARLRDGKTIAEAQREARTIASVVTDQDAVSADRRMTIWMEPIHDYSLGRTKPAISLLGAVTVLILLVSCLSVATLLIANVAERRYEFEIKLSLGATRVRIIADVLAESAILSLTAGGLAILATALLQPMWRSILPNWTPRVEDIRTDLLSVGWTTLMVGAATAFVGLVPILTMPGPSAGAVAHRANAHAKRIRQIIVGTETCLVVLLLMCGGWFLQSLRKLHEVDLGFAAKDVISAEVRLLHIKYRSSAELKTFHRSLGETIYALPIVQSMAFASAGPFAGSDAVETVTALPGRERLIANRRRVDAAYFSVLGLRVLEGRVFSDRDQPGVAVISASFARALFGEGPAVGRKFLTFAGPFEVIGTVGDLRSRRVQDAPLPAYYLPWIEQPTQVMTILIRTEGPANMLDIAAAIQRATGGEPVHRVARLDALVAASIGDHRAYAIATSGLGIVTLLISALGLCGLVIHSITRRTRELGIRAALGGTPRMLLGAIFSESMTAVLGGLAAGLILTFWFFEIVAPLLFGVARTDVAPYAVTVTALLAVSILTGAIPAYRILGIDVSAALREH
jgi:putative ABC transport system permease protein